MIRFECDNCGNTKEDAEIWIMGFAAERMGVTEARREVVIASSWDDDRAAEPLAIHLCSEECRAEYIQKLFGGSATAEAGDRAGRYSGAITEEVVVARGVKPAARRNRSRKSA
jgi:hypothetical protein